MREVCARIGAFWLLLLAASGSRACPNDAGPHSVADPDGAGGGTRANCSSPICETGCTLPVACTPVSGVPFTRLSQTESGPLDGLGVACFGVAKRGTGAGGTYSLFDDTGENNDTSFRRYGSTDGLVWDDGVLTTGLTNGTWAQIIQCPDPRYTGPSGQMELYYNARKPPPNGTAFRIAFATSTNGGVDWTMHTDPIVIPDATHYPYMPSAVQYNGKWLLAYAWTNKTNIGEAFIRVRELDTPTDPTPTTLTDNALGLGTPGEWDDGTRNRPRLVVDIDGERIHMFYSGFPLYAGGPVRDCGGIGHAVSCDGGVTWAKTADPVLQRRDDGNWNDKHVLKPTLVWESPPRRLRLYFEGGACDGEAGGLGVAEALWNTPFFNDLCSPRTFLLSDQIDDGIQRTPAAELPARIVSTPNPTRGETVIGIELAPAQRIGTADLTVYDVAGRVVRELWSGAAESIPSNIAWDGRDAGGTRVADGRYLVRLRIDGEGAAADWVTMIR